MPTKVATVPEWDNHLSSFEVRRHKIQTIHSHRVTSRRDWDQGADQGKSSTDMSRDDVGKSSPARRKWGCSVDINLVEASGSGHGVQEHIRSS